ncbi:hypothetical protein JCM10212_001281 [Sporobolomyces blumeae]
MSSSRSTRDVSIDSHDLGVSDGEHDEDGPVDNGSGPSTGKRKGKGKATTSREADRKIQNRIAQREFRQRKQAYIKELEAKVKLQEMNRDEQIGRYSNAVRTLLKENQRLRELLAGVSGFINEGLGGALPRLGTTLPGSSFSFISRSYIDDGTGALGLDELQSPATPTTTDRMPSVPIPQHRATYPPSTMPYATSAPQPPALTIAATSGVFLPPASIPPIPPKLPAPTPDPLRLPSKPIQPNPSSIETRDEQLSPIPPDNGNFDSEQNEDYVRWVVGQVREGNMDAVESDAARHQMMSSTSPAIQAIQLISYHMQRKREHPEYNLPPSLRSTSVQNLVPHNAVFDGIIFPSLRDRLILLKDQYSLSELTDNLYKSLRVHGNDCLLAENWELSADFLKKYWFVIDDTVLSISNRWRKSRGEPELTMSDLVPPCP